MVGNGKVIMILDGTENSLHLPSKTWLITWNLSPLDLIKNN